MRPWTEEIRQNALNSTFRNSSCARTIAGFGELQRPACGKMIGGILNRRALAKALLGRQRCPRTSGDLRQARRREVLYVMWSLQAVPESMRDGEKISMTDRWGAIAMLDVVDFTRLMEFSEGETLARWNSLLHGVILPKIRSFCGKTDLSGIRGDSVLAVFPSVGQAVACLREIQEEVASHEGEHPSITLRGGIHAGWLKSSSERFNGTNVNIACRLQAFSAPGGIVVSESVKDLLDPSFAGRVDDLGELSLKGLERRVRGFSLLRRPKWLLARERSAIAILPFIDTDTSASPYFGDGIIDDIINALSCLPELNVISRTSTLTFRRGVEDIGSVRKTFRNVRYVLTGTVQRANGQIRIKSTLSGIESEETRVLWTDHIEGDTSALFKFQDSVSRHIVSTVAPHLREAEISRALQRTGSLTAYDCFLRGLDLLYRLEPKTFHGAREMFEQAMRLDPRYAAPYSHSALWYAVCIGQGWSMDVQADMKKVSDLAEAAMKLDETDVSSISLCGHVQSILHRKYQEALRLFERANSAAPNSAIAWVRSSPTFSYLGDWREGYRRGMLGLEFGAHDRHVFYTYSVLCLAAYTGEEYEEAIEWGSKAREHNPDFTGNLRLLCAALVGANRLEEAQQVAREVLRVTPSFRVLPFAAGYAYRDLERRNQLASKLAAAGLPS